MALSEKKKLSNERWDSKNLKRLSLAMLLNDYNEMEAHLEKVREAQKKEGGKEETRNAFINRAIKLAIRADEVTISEDT